MTPIIIAGYPKSGNTWVTRLAAELVGCPVTGFWQSSRDEIACEGQERQSEFACFKAHHPLQELGNADDLAQAKIIYVVRDPRDVVVSGAHFFTIDRWPHIGRRLERLPLLPRLYRMLVNPTRYRIARMTDAVLYGSAELHVWLRTPWAAHVAAYRDAGHLMVKYEDLLRDPQHECRRMLDYLGLKRSEQAIRDAIEAQSFGSKKRAFRKNADATRAKFLRAGKSGEWKTALSAAQKQLFLDVLADDLARLEYPADAAS